ncbi:MAG TPA: hypothetical protein VIV61_07575, partial [Candidatus Ozemobacteraceae bacterium]
LTGGTRSYFLAGNATSAVELPATCLAMPIREGFLWNLKRPGLRAWEALLTDGYGNLMKRVSKFTTEFDPTGLTCGPNGPEGELLISCYSGTGREVSLLGQNGRMLWKLPMQNAVVPRDLAWDREGNLLVLERDGDGLVLNRITFAIPQG